MLFFVALLIAVVACMVTALLIVALRPAAVRLGLVDRPGERKLHEGVVPLVGGVAIFLAVLLVYLGPAAAGVFPVDRRIVSFLGGGALLVLVGLLDDRYDLSPNLRLLAQVGAGLIMVYGGGGYLRDVGALAPSGAVVELGWLAVPFTVFATIGVINALNMSDGLDGLSSSLALISVSGLMIAASVGGEPTDAVLLALLAGSVFGFWLLNFRIPGRHRASVFMGDAGSMFLGFALTWFTIKLSQEPMRVMTPSAALWFLMVPIFDTVAMMLRRLSKGRSPFTPDREHLHHVFLLARFSVNETVVVMVAAAMIGVGIGLTTMDLRVPEFWVSGSFLAVGLMYFWMITRSWQSLRFLDRSICRRRATGDRRSGRDRRHGQDPAYAGPERRSGFDRRCLPARRRADGRAASTSARPVPADKQAAIAKVRPARG